MLSGSRGFHILPTLARDGESTGAELARALGADRDAVMANQLGLLVVGGAVEQCRIPADGRRVFY
jgi:DNA-binding MarR family transcriptional regulator